MNQQCYARTINKNGPQCSCKIHKNKLCVKHYNLKKKFKVLKWGYFIQIRIYKSCLFCKKTKPLKEFIKYSTKLDKFCRVCKKNINRKNKIKRENNIKLLKNINDKLPEEDLKFIVKKYESLKKLAEKRGFKWKIDLKDLFNIVLISWQSSLSLSLNSSSD